jgi:hypothetical protein
MLKSRIYYQILVVLCFVVIGCLDRDDSIIESKLFLTESNNSVNQVLRVNESYSVRITLTDGRLSDFVPIKAENFHKYGVLQLPANETNFNENEVILFNVNFNDSNQSNIVSYRGGVGPSVEYSCECNSGTYDCTLRTYNGNLKACDGNFCSACSVVVSGAKTNNGDIFSGKSAIIFSNIKSI